VTSVLVTVKLGTTGKRAKLESADVGG